MALSATRLRDAIKTALDTRFGVLTGDGNTNRLGFASDLATAIVAEITANGKARIAGTTPGPGLSGLQKANGDPTAAPDEDKDIPLV